jgi:acyl-coenzyme A thioesterase PaaI-like protein
MSVVELHRRLSRWPGGRWLFARVLCFRAPYFGSIAPRIDVLEPGRCIARLRDHRRVRNHVGTVHAIALCNLAEPAGGLMVDATLPASMRWIPRGLQVEYLHKAVGGMTATARTTAAIVVAGSGYELPLKVEITDPAGQTVFRARIDMWISPRRTPSA